MPRLARNVYLGNARAALRRAWILRGYARAEALSAAIDWTVLAFNTPADELMPEADLTTWGLGPEVRA